MTSERAQTDMGWGPSYGPFTYTLLSEPALSDELRRLSDARVLLPGVDSVSLQPCPNPSERSQDRYCTERWTMPDGDWTFCAVFDGESS
jgi:pyruvate dehydrogenase phosphatase